MAYPNGVLDGRRPAVRTKGQVSYYLLSAVMLFGLLLTLLVGSHLPFNALEGRQSDLRRRQSPLGQISGSNVSRAALPSLFQKRSILEAEWNKKVTDGRSYKGLWRMMNDDTVRPGGVTQAVLESTGWGEEEAPDELADDYRKKLGLPSGILHPENDVAREWYHDDVWRDYQGRIRHPTHAVFSNIVNGDDGYIIAGSNWNPAKMAQELEGKEKEEFQHWMIPSTKWSDIMAVQWGQHASSGTLTRVFRSQILTESTRDLMDGALTKVGKEGGVDMGDWPGEVFQLQGDPNQKQLAPKTEAFLALLASVHAAGPAFLLAQYREIFGKRRIHQIRVWRTTHGPNMAMYIEGA